MRIPLGSFMHVFVRMVMPMALRVFMVCMPMFLFRMGRIVGEAAVMAVFMSIFMAVYMAAAAVSILVPAFPGMFVCHGFPLIFRLLKTL